MRIATRAYGSLTLLLLLSAAALSAPARTAALHISSRARRHITEEHFPGGKRTSGKSIFNAGEDLDKLVALAVSVPAVREPNGRDKRIVHLKRPIGLDGRTGRPVASFVVIAEPDGEVVTAYPGR